MNYYYFNYTNKEGEEKQLKLRLTSGDAIAIENLKKMSVIKCLQDESINMTVTFLKYLVKQENNQPLSFDNAQKLYDELIDSGMSMKKIIIEIIYEALVVSGFLEKEEWEEMKKAITTQDKKKMDIITEIL